MRLFFISILVAISSVAIGQELDAPSEIASGALAVLDASDIPSSGRAWQAVNAPPLSYRVVDDGQRLVFATAKPGRYWFVFAYTEDISETIIGIEESRKAFALAIAKGDQPEELKTAHESLLTITSKLVSLKTQPRQITHELVVTGVVPDDKEEAKPEPEPVIPDGQYSLALLSRSEAMKLTDYSAAGKVEAVYASIVKRILNGELKTEAGAGKFGQKVFGATGIALAASITPAEAGIWKPWGASISDAINFLSDNGDVKSDADLATAYSEISIGLNSLNAKPTPVVKKDVAWVIVIEETAERTPESALVMTDLDWWTSLSSRGITWRHYDDDSEEAKEYLQAVGSTKLPAVLLLETDGSVISTFTLPNSKELLDSSIRGGK